MGVAVNYEVVTRDGRPLRTFGDPKMANEWLTKRCVADGARLEKVQTTRKILAVKP